MTASDVPLARGASNAMALWAGGLALAGLGCAAAWLRLGLPLPACRFRAWTGLPCASCGTTRMLLALLDADVGGAIAANPLVFATLAVLVVWSIRSVFLAATGRPRRSSAPHPRTHRGLALGALAALVAGWAYQIWYAP